MNATDGSAAQRWLSEHCDHWQSVSGALVARADAASQRLHNLARWPLQGPLDISLIGAAKAAIQGARPVVVVPPVGEGDGAHAGVISLPVPIGDGSLAALAVALRSPAAVEPASFVRELESASASLGFALTSVGAEGGSLEAGRVLHMLSMVVARAGLAEGVSELVNELAVGLGFERVSLGLFRQGQLRVIALSHSGDFEQRQDLIQRLAAVMDEAAEQGYSVVYPPRPDDPPRIILAHAELVRHTGTAIATVPLVWDGRPIGAIALERGGESPPAPEEIGLCEHIASVLAPMLAVKQRAERSLLAHAGAGLARVWERLCEHGNPRPKLAVVAVLAVIALSFVPVTHRVGAPARIEGAVQRVLTAPMDGYLRKVQVRPGDSVQAGDVLAELHDQDLLVEQRRWQAEVTQHENALTAAMANADRAELSISHAKTMAARAQLALVESQLGRARITAPIDGIVTDGDLTQTIGAPVRRGDLLLTLVPVGQYRLVVEVDERDVAHLEPGQRGRLALAALPAQPLGFSVERVTPVAVTRDGRNSFEVEATLDEDSTPLRPGLHGVAKIEVGTRTLADALTGRLADWLRLTLWSWSG